MIVIWFKGFRFLKKHSLHDLWKDLKVREEDHKHCSVWFWTHKLKTNLGDEGKGALRAHDELREIKGIVFTVIHLPERIACWVFRHLWSCFLNKLLVIHNKLTHLSINLTFKSRKLFFLLKLIFWEGSESSDTSIRKHHFKSFYIVSGFSVLQGFFSSWIVWNNTAKSSNVFWSRIWGKEKVSFLCLLFKVSVIDTRFNNSICVCNLMNLVHVLGKHGKEWVGEWTSWHTSTSGSRRYWHRLMKLFKASCCPHKLTHLSGVFRKRHYLRHPLKHTRIPLIHIPYRLCIAHFSLKETF